MHVYCAVSGTEARIAALADLYAWASQRINNKQAKIVKILKVRPNETHARIVMEITKDGLFPTPNGRIIPVPAIKRAIRNGSKT